MKKIIIPQEVSNQRLDKFLLKYFNTAPKALIYKWLRKKYIKLNNAKSFGNEIIKPNDQVFLYLSNETIKKFCGPIKKIKSNKPINILFENNNILICEKPIGLLSQPNSKYNQDSVLNRLYSLYNHNDIFICNRLDRNTSGIIICAKNFLAAQNMNNIISKHLIDKYYLAIVIGKINKPGILENFIIKNSLENKSKLTDNYKNKNLEPLDFKNSLKDNLPKKIITQYEPIEYSDKFSLIKIKLITGRSHQIRLHLKSINHPIIGDKKYGDTKTNLFFEQKFALYHQLLHAYKIKFNSGELNNKIITCPIPKIFLDIKNYLF